MPYIPKRDLDTFRRAAERGQQYIAVMPELMPCMESKAPIECLPIPRMDIIADIVPMLVDRIKELQDQLKDAVVVKLDDINELCSYAYHPTYPPDKDALDNIKKAIHCKYIEDSLNNDR